MGWRVEQITIWTCDKCGTESQGTVRPNGWIIVESPNNKLGDRLVNCTKCTEQAQKSGRGKK